MARLAFQTAVEARQQLDSQLRENQQVAKEFGKLTANNQVYKLIGPVLVKQDQVEAKSNVDKRIEFIKSEMYVPFSSPLPLFHPGASWLQLIEYRSGVGGLYPKPSARVEVQLKDLTEKSDKKKVEVSIARYQSVGTEA